MRVTDEDFLQYYQQELNYLRKMGSHFAEKYPKIAGRLELGVDESADPNVERMLEAFAFLTARIQNNIESEFPKVTSALLDILCPHYIKPVPSMTIARFEVDPDQGQLTDGGLVPRHTPLYAESEQGYVCRFRTAYPVTLWPIELVEAGFESTDQFDFLDATTEVATVLRLKLQTSGPPFPEMSLKRLRFYLQGERTLTNTLYELLFNQVFRIALLPEKNRPIFLSKEAILPVGFGRDENVLVDPPNAHPGQRLLQEYFTFPEKFFFFDIDHLDANTSPDTLDILILLKQMPNQRLSVDTNTFLLGCTPIVNLFHKTTEPIRIDHRHTEYRLNPDMRRERWTEIHTILKVSVSSNKDEDVQEFAPFYAYNHELDGRAQTAFWYAHSQLTRRRDIPGTEMHISFLDLDFNRTVPPVEVAYAHTLCTNRSMAEQLSAGSVLQIEEAAPVTNISCLAKPTRQLTPPLGGQNAWRLISHLSLNYLSLAEGQQSLKALREILSLYNFDNRPSIYRQIVGVRELKTQRVIRNVGVDSWRGFCKGLEITVTFDEDAYVGSSAFLLAAVLNHFFSLYTSVNSFTQLVIQSNQREGIWKQWKPMAGGKIIL